MDSILSKIIMHVVPFFGDAIRHIFIVKGMFPRLSAVFNSFLFFTNIFSIIISGGEMLQHLLSDEPEVTVMIKVIGARYFQNLDLKLLFRQGNVLDFT